MCYKVCYKVCYKGTLSWINAAKSTLPWINVVNLLQQCFPVHWTLSVEIINTCVLYYQKPKFPCVQNINTFDSENLQYQHIALFLLEFKSWIYEVATNASYPYHVVKLRASVLSDTLSLQSWNVTLCLFQNTGTYQGPRGQLPSPVIYSHTKIVSVLNDFQLRPQVISEVTSELKAIKIPTVKIEL